LHYWPATTSRSAEAPPDIFIEWLICDDSGASVGSELIDPDGAEWTDDGSFNCSSCRFADEEEP
jgi:hypothetical protein